MDVHIYATAPLLTFIRVYHKLTTDLLSMEAMTCTTDEQTLVQNAAYNSAAIKQYVNNTKNNFPRTT